MLDKVSCAHSLLAPCMEEPITRLGVQASNVSRCEVDRLPCFGSSVSHVAARGDNQRIDRRQTPRQTNGFSEQ
jgi:hypothetical protein